jgi:hypothetical protein
MRVLVAALLALLVAGCGGDDEPAARTSDGSRPCSQVGELDGAPERQPPPDLAVLSYSRLFKSEGSTFYAELDGTPQDLPARRDDAQNELVQSWGFASLKTGQQDGVEATAHLKGAEHTVDLQVAPLCKGKIQLRYTVR